MKLEQTGLVKRIRSETSDREVTVSLTAEGKRTFRKCYPRILREAHAYMNERLTRKEKRTLVQALQKFVA